MDTKISLGYNTLRYIQIRVSEVEKDSGLSIEDLGKGHYRVIVWDKTGFEVARFEVGPSDLSNRYD